MATIEEKRAQRWKFMRVLYEATGGDTFKTLNMRVLGDETQLSEQETGTLVEYLVHENLVEWAAMGGVIRLAHRGVVEVEESLSTPTRATQHFPPVVNILNVQTMVGSQIQQGTSESSQSISKVEVGELNAVRRFIAAIRGAEAQLELSPEAMRDLDAELSTLEGQMRSSSPKRSVLHSVLETTKGILKSAPGQAAVADLIRELPELLGH
jgi:hypothetical protein